MTGLARLNAFQERWGRRKSLFLLLVIPGLLIAAALLALPAGAESGKLDPMPFGFIWILFGLMLLRILIGLPITLRFSFGRARYLVTTGRIRGYQVPETPKPAMTGTFLIFAMFQLSLLCAFAILLLAIMVLAAINYALAASIPLEVVGTALLRAVMVFPAVSVAGSLWFHGPTLLRRAFRPA